MAVIGEASAVLGVLQLGFSLATALSSYISDFRDAREDISALSSEIQATLYQLNDLNALIEKNEITHCWTYAGLKNAQKCVTDSEKIVENLRKLLQKSTSTKTDRLEREDIDVTLFCQAKWPWLKPDLEVHKRNLMDIQIRILIAHSSYMTKAGSSPMIRRNATEGIAGLVREELIRKRELRETKKRAQKDKRIGGSRGSTRRTRRLRRGSRDYRGSIDPNDLDLDNDEKLTELEEIFREEFNAEQLRIKSEKTKREKEREELIEEWKKKTLEEAKAKQKRIQDDKNKWHKELVRRKLPPKQIELILDDMFPKTVDDPLHALMIDAQSAGSTNMDFENSVLSLTGITPPSSRFSTRLKRIFRSRNTTLGQAPAHRVLPSIIQDSTGVGGLAVFEACYFGPSEKGGFQQYEMGIPDQWMLKRLIEREEGRKGRPQKMRLIHEEFHLLPEGCKSSIIQWLHDKNRKNYKWVLVYADRIINRTRRGFLGLVTQEGQAGAFVIFKRQTVDEGDASSLSSESEYMYKEPDRSYSRNESSPITTRRRSRSSDTPTGRSPSYRYRSPPNMRSRSRDNGLGVDGIHDVEGPEVYRSESVNKVDGTSPRETQRPFRHSSYDPYNEGGPLRDPYGPYMPNPFIPPFSNRRDYFPGPNMWYEESRPSPRYRPFYPFSHDPNNREAYTPYQGFSPARSGSYERLRKIDHPSVSGESDRYNEMERNRTSSGRGRTTPPRSSHVRMRSPIESVINPSSKTSSSDETQSEESDSENDESESKISRGDTDDEIRKKVLDKYVGGTGEEAEVDEVDEAVEDEKKQDQRQEEEDGERRIEKNKED
ncbi:MAG: hypothetical protein M1834_007008 [Cirrosporium novae-zelandiae]|nr:MAG: hypothetical protein M1834_007008 [Cirrosporium novae-zelandiae]